MMQRSREIIDRAIAEYKPYAIAMMLSGGDDSLTAFYVARALNIPIDFILHGNTRTGVKQTTEFVRRFAQDMSTPYIEADAGDMFERRVLRKGWYGRGDAAHSMAYHRLKQDPFVAAISAYIRHGKRGRNILMINGFREQESANRKKQAKNPIARAKENSPNIWVNIIHHWSKGDCLDFLNDCKAQRNPVAELCHRSGECMCGTMQGLEARQEVSYWFPDWGRWLDRLEKQVQENGFYWGWGEGIPESFANLKQREKEIKNGQLDLFNDWLPMCQSCMAQR